MISLRQFIDNYRSTAERKPGQPLVFDSPAVDDRAVAAFRSTLLAMGVCGKRAVPSAGDRMSVRIAEIDRNLEQQGTAEALQNASEQLRAELYTWAESALRSHNENERDIKEILGVVARAAAAIGTRDETHTREIGQLGAKIRNIAEMKDLAAIRSSILDQTSQLQSCVEKLVREGKAALTELASEVHEYRSRLEASERESAIDPLTRLANRGAFEKEITLQITMRRSFALILLDLNDFKSVNDQYGHLAGDELLRQFSKELRAPFGPSELVCRWGGDEFVIIIPGSVRDATERVNRIKRWVLGEYKLGSPSNPTRVAVGAALGIVQWNGNETAASLVARADAEMYKFKNASRQPAAPAIRSRR